MGGKTTTPGAGATGVGCLQGGHFRFVVLWARSAATDESAPGVPMFAQVATRTRSRPPARARGARRAPSSGRLDPFAARRDRYAPVLEVLGLADTFAAMPRRFQELIWRRKLPDPIVKFDDSAPKSARERRTLAREIERNLHDATFEADGRTLLVRDHHTIVFSLMLVARGTQLDGTLPESVEAFIRLAGERASAFYEAQQEPVSRALHQAVMAPIAAHSRHDVRLYTAEFTAELTDRKKHQPTVLLRTHAPEVRRVTLDGAERRIYRITRSLAGDGPEWLSAPAYALPRKGEPRPPRSAPPLPVYVQSHALHQLRRRLNYAPAAPYLEAWLADSFDEPVGVKRQAGGDWLVPYSLKERRLGYLIVTPLPEMLVVRTFLFLTMEATPEADALRRELKLSRRDVEWLGLADLAAFTQTDLRDDPELHKLFRRCGCGHLFKLDEIDCAPAASHPLAAEVRRYLRLAA